MDTIPLNWRPLTASVRGAAHERSGLPNQDAIRVARLDAGRALLIALADGHGSAKSFRSQPGARLAVATAYWAVRALFDSARPPSLKHWAEDRLPVELVRGWQARVNNRLQRYPFTPTELDSLDIAARQPLEQHPLVAYGSTLLTVLITPGFILYVQLGDGDILVVNADGEVERPFPRDPRLIANETTSLCSPQAWNDVQVRFQTLAGAPPALILAATDGYANAFRDESGFQQAARDYWTLLRDGGEPAVRPHLTEWLNEASRLGSGDDVSLGLIWRPAHSKTRLV
jgi:hypothetical protein